MQSIIDRLHYSSNWRKWMNRGTKMTLEEVHTNLQQAFDTVGVMYEHLPLLRSDTAFAIGEAIGTLAKAKALVSRDNNDEILREQGSHSTLSTHLTTMEAIMRSPKRRDLFSEEGDSDV